MMKLLIISALVALTVGKVIDTRSCLTTSEEETALKINSIRLEPCDTPEDEPCILKKGGKTQLQIDMTAVQAEGDLVDRCHGRVGFWVPFPLEITHQCKVSGICPMKVGAKGHYVYEIEVSAFYPSIRVPVRWELVRSDGTRALCIEMTTQLR